MQRQVRQTLLALLIAFYGAVTVCGGALHALPGFEHGQAGMPADDDGANPTSSHDDCPLCTLLAQGQLAGDYAQVPSMDVVQIQPADDLPLHFPLALSLPASPRAPPLA